MQTYIINLKKDTDRKEYIKEELSIYHFLHINFTEAINGKSMSEQELNLKFDNKKAFQLYGRKCSPAEIGCTLSHCAIYKKITDLSIPYALILEDDIKIVNKKFQEAIAQSTKILDRETKPTIILLSGAYTYSQARRLTNDIKLVNVYGATLAHSYIINLPAAQLLIQQIPCIQADDWEYISQCGIKVKAILPHLIEQNRKQFNISNIWEESHKYKKRTLRNLFKSAINASLSIIGHKERG